MENDTRDCPFCAETIKASAIKCQYCESTIQPVSTSHVRSENTQQSLPIFNTSSSASIPVDQSVTKTGKTTSIKSKGKALNYILGFFIVTITIVYFFRSELTEKNITSSNITSGSNVLKTIQVTKQPWINDTIFEGAWSYYEKGDDQGFPNGKGKILFKTGRTDEGTFTNGELRGRVKRTLPNGEIVNGEYKKVGISESIYMFFSDRHMPSEKLFEFINLAVDERFDCEKESIKESERNTACRYFKDIMSRLNDRNWCLGQRREDPQLYEWHWCNSDSLRLYDFVNKKSSAQSESGPNTKQQSSNGNDIDKRSLVLNEFFKNTLVKPDFKNIESTEPILIRNNWARVPCKERQEIGLSCFTKDNQVIEIEWAPAGRMGGTIGEIKIYQYQPQRSQSDIVWNHNNSKMKVVMNNDLINIHYIQPRQAMLDAGAKPNDLLINGAIKGTQINGIARIFAGKCGQFTYTVSGAITSNGTVINLNGQAPVVDRSNCQITKYVPDPLSFNVIQTNTQSNSQTSQPQANTDVEIKYANGDFYLGKVRNGVQDGYGGYWFSSRSELISTTWSNGKMVNGSDAFLKNTSAEKRSLPQISGKIVDGKFVSLSTLDLRKKIVSLNDEMLKLENQNLSKTGFSYSFDLKKFNFDGLYDDIKLNDILARLEGYRDLYQKELESSIANKILEQISKVQQEIFVLSNESSALSDGQYSPGASQNSRTGNNVNDVVTLTLSDVKDPPIVSQNNNTTDSANYGVKLTEQLRQLIRTRDSMKEQLDTAYRLAPSLKIQ